MYAYHIHILNEVLPSPPILQSGRAEARSLVSTEHVVLGVFCPMLGGRPPP